MERIIGFRVDYHRYLRLKELSEELGISTSELMRIALDILLYTAEIERINNTIYVVLNAEKFVYIKEKEGLRDDAKLASDGSKD